MSLYTRARRHIDMNRVKELYDNRIAEQIALAEKQYLLYFTENTIPKYYDWETGQFNVTPLAEIKGTVLKRLEEIESALAEGMKMKDFNYLYGGELGSQILSISPTLVSSTFAQDLISASGEVTSHMFGPDFPGSHINSIGDFGKPQSLSKVDAQASASWNSIQDVTPSGWTPNSSYEYNDSVSDVVTPGQESDTFKDTHFGEVTATGTDFSLSTGNDDDKENTVDIADLNTLFPGVTFPDAFGVDPENPGDPMEASMLLRTFKSIKVGQEITFDYSFTTLETEEDDSDFVVNYKGVSSSVPGDDMNEDDYGFVLIAGRVQKIVSVMASDGNTRDFTPVENDDGLFKPDILQSKFPVTGKYSYTVKQDDIDDHGNLKLFVGVMDSGDNVYQSCLDITNFKLDSSRLAAGQLGKTTDAYNLGTSVASLDPNKKKKEKEQEERLKKDKEYKKKEEERKRKEEEEKKKEKKPLTLNQVEKIYMKKYANPNDPEDAYRRYKVWEYNYGRISYFTKDADGTYNYEEAGRISAMIPFRMNPGIPFTKGAELGGDPPSTKAEVMAHANKYKKHKKEIDNYNAVQEWKKTKGPDSPYQKSLVKARDLMRSQFKPSSIPEPKVSQQQDVPLSTLPTPKKITPTQQKQLQKAVSDTPEVADAIDKFGSAAMTYFDYLTGRLPDTIDNDYLGTEYVNSIFKDAVVNDKGKISVGDNIVGTGGKATYDPETKLITIPFNYDFNTNSEEIAKNPERFDDSALNKVFRGVATILGGNYGLDSLPVVPAGYATALAKSLGGAKQRPGKVTMSAAEVNKLNPLLHAQIVGTTGLTKEELYPGQPSPNGFPDTPPPKMVNGYHPEFGKRSDRYRTLDPISAKTMNKVGTDDPKTNKQVAAAAKKPKVNESTWDKLKRHRPRG